MQQAAGTTMEAVDREALRARFHADPFTFIAEGYRHLAGQPDDGEIRVMLIRVLASLGLGVPARELLSGDPNLGDLDVDAQELRTWLRAVDPGRASWDELAPMFATNLAALQTTHPDLATTLQRSERELRRHQLFRTTNGTLHLSHTVFGGLRRWIPAFVDQRQCDGMDLPLDAGGPSPLVAGVGLNDLIDRVHSQTTAPPGVAQVPIYIVEPSLAQLFAWLHAADHGALLSDHRVHLCAGDDAVDAYAALLQHNESLGLPGVNLRFAWSAPLAARLDAIRESIHRQRDTDCRAIIRLHADRSRQRSSADWAARLRPGATVLGVTSRHTTMLQYSMRDIAHAFEQLGYRFELLTEPADDHRHTTLTYGRAIHEIDPALVVLLNHFRQEQPDAMGDVPVLTWIQDPSDIVLSHRTGAAIGRHDFVCGYYIDRCVREFGYPADRFMTAVLPVSERVFHSGPVPDADRRRCACDVMYVGHRHATPDNLHADWLAGTPPITHPLLERARQRIEHMIVTGEHLVAPRRLIAQLATELNLQMPDEPLEKLANYYAFRMFDTMFREQTLHWVCRWADRTGRKLRLYGRGWQDDPVLGRYAMGAIEHGEPLRCAYSTARIVLLTMPAGFLHQRTYEALASGSFVLARYAPASFHMKSAAEVAAGGIDWSAFPCAATKFPGLEQITFTDEASFTQLADRALADDDARSAVADRFRGYVNDRFTYTAVVPHLVEWIRTGPAGGDARAVAEHYRRHIAGPPRDDCGR